MWICLWFKCNRALFCFLALTVTLSLLLFSFFFFPQLPTLFPPGKGPFASLARASTFHHFYLMPSSPPFFFYRAADVNPLVLALFLFLILSFYLPFIWGSLFKDRVVAMRKPNCNYSICNFCSTFRAYSSASFRVFPCSSVANLLLLLGLPSVAILLLCLCLPCDFAK